jgi:hypothetical protein
MNTESDDSEMEKPVNKKPRMSPSSDEAGFELPSSSLDPPAKETTLTTIEMLALVAQLDFLAKCPDFCELCRKSFPNLQRHVAELHGSSATMPCIYPNCRGKFKREKNSNLVNHVWSSHLQDGVLLFEQDLTRWLNHSKYKEFQSNIYEKLVDDEYYCKVCHLYTKHSEISLHFAQVHNADKLPCPDLGCQEQFAFSEKKDIMDHFDVSGQVTIINLLLMLNYDNFRSSICSVNSHVEFVVMTRFI